VFRNVGIRVINQTKEDEITNHVYHYTSLMEEAEDSVSKSEYIFGVGICVSARESRSTGTTSEGRKYVNIK
jgi:hypothetical protein